MKDNIRTLATRIIIFLSYYLEYNKLAWSVEVKYPKRGGIEYRINKSNDLIFTASCGFIDAFRKVKNSSF